MKHRDTEIAEKKKTEKSFRTPSFTPWSFDFPISIFEFPFFLWHGILARFPLFAQSPHRFAQAHR